MDVKVKLQVGSPPGTEEVERKEARRGRPGAQKK